MMKNIFRDFWAILVLSCVTLGLSLAGAQESKVTEAMSLLNQGKNSEAAAMFEKETANNPESYDAQLGLGMAYLNLGRYGDARGSLEKAVALNPLSVAANYNLAMLYEREGNAARAVAAWRKVSELSPDRNLKDLAAKHISQLEGK